jgi:hypothetical protein
MFVHQDVIDLAATEPEDRPKFMEGWQRYQEKTQGLIITEVNR